MFKFKETTTKKKTPSWKKCKNCLHVQGTSKKLCGGCDNDKFWIIPITNESRSDAQ